MSFGYGTKEFEVTTERLGCYRPEEHIDNPKDYAGKPLTQDWYLYAADIVDVLQITSMPGSMTEDFAVRWTNVEN